MSAPEAAPRSSRTLPLLIVGAVVLASVTVTAGSLYRKAHRDSGVAPRNDALPELCKIVSPETLAKARTTNGDARYSISTTYETSCVWDQTLGRDGAGMRTLVVNIGKPHNPELMFSSYVDVQTQGQASEVTALDGVGDDAKSVLTAKQSDPRVVSGHVVRKGAHVVAVRYVGADPSLFSREANPDVPGLQAMSRAVLDEVLGKL